MGLFSKPDTHSVLLIDIASSSMGIGLSGIREGALPELVFTARVPFAYKQDFDLAHLEPAMFHALRTVLGVGHREGPHLLRQKGFPAAINHAVISFSSPWYASGLGSDHHAFRRELEERHAAPVEVFEMQDGIMSAAERRLVKKIEEEVIRTFGIKEGIGLSSFTFSFSRVIRHAFSGADTAHFIDMTSHMTDILSMRGGSYTGHVSMPAGTSALKSLSSIDWDAFWDVFHRAQPGAAHHTVFLVSDDHGSSRAHLSERLPAARIISFGPRGGFLDEMVRAPQGLAPLDRLAVLATYSNLFL